LCLSFHVPKLIKLISSISLFDQKKRRKYFQQKKKLISTVFKKKREVNRENKDIQILHTQNISEVLNKEEEEEDRCETLIKTSAYNIEQLSHSSKKKVRIERIERHFFCIQIVNNKLNKREHSVAVLIKKIFSLLNTKTLSISDLWWHIVHLTLR